MKDQEDQALEALFRSEPVADDGFSRQVMRRIRRRIWVRRLAVPAAVLVGAGFAFQPVVEILRLVSGLFADLPAELLQASTGGLPQVSTMLIVAAVVAAAVIAGPVLED